MIALVGEDVLPGMMVSGPPHGWIRLFRRLSDLRKPEARSLIDSEYERVELQPITVITVTKKRDIAFVMVHVDGQVKMGWVVTEFLYEL